MYQNEIFLSSFIFVSFLKSIHLFRDNGGMPIVFEIIYRLALLAASRSFSSKFLTALSNLNCFFSNFESRLKDMSKSGFLTSVFLDPGTPRGLQARAEQVEGGDGCPQEVEAQGNGCCGDDFCRGWCVY